MKHDATTGFHDIKPLPTFSLATNNLVLISFLFPILLLALFLLIKKLHSRKPISLDTQPSPHQIAKTEISKLETQREEEKINDKLFSTLLSQEIRTYLAAVLSFPAEDFTPYEINEALTKLLKQKIPGTSEDKRKLWRHELISFLLLIEQLAYASESAADSSANQVVLSQQATTAINLINQLEAWLIKEQQRKDSLITNQSSVPNTNAFA